jgi:mannose PTS system EIID component
MTRLPLRVKLAVLARSLLIQGSWNYRTMVGTGMGFTLLPALRHLHRKPDELDEAVARHSMPFNAHPYLAELAIGSLVRLETDGADAQTVGRFRSAVGGPLGALGDRVVWAVWLPLTALVGLVAFEAGLGAGTAVVLFLALYNAGHFLLRWWGFHAGLNEGVQVAARLRTAGLVRRARRAEGALVLLAGVLAGLVLTGPEGLGGVAWPWTVAAAGALVAGVVLGARAWRPTALVVVLAVTLLLAKELVL